MEPPSDRPDPIVVCAACRNKHDGFVVTSARHYDPLMRKQMNAHCESAFLTRKEAWVIAKKNGQIRREVSSPGTLYSENLY